MRQRPIVIAVRRALAEMGARIRLARAQRRLTQHLREREAA